MPFSIVLVVQAFHLSSRDWPGNGHFHHFTRICSLDMDTIACILFCREGEIREEEKVSFCDQNPFFFIDWHRNWWVFSNIADVGINIILFLINSQSDMHFLIHVIFDCIGFRSSRCNLKIQHLKVMSSPSFNFGFSLSLLHILGFHISDLCCFVHCSIFLEGGWFLIAHHSLSSC